MALPIAKTAIAATLALATALTSATPALALGEREKGAIVGIFGTLIIQDLLRDGQQRRNPSVYYQPAPPPVYHNPRPQPQPGYYQAPQQNAYSTLSYTFRSYSLRERQAIQRELAAWGYYGGRIDGSFGQGTYSAVVAYARRSGQSDALRSQSGAYGIYDSLLY